MTTFLDASQELVDALQLTDSEAAAKAERYCRLKQARYVTDDGEVISKFDMDKELAILNAELKAYIDQRGPVTVEGLGTLNNQQRSGSVLWDAENLAKHEPDEYQRLLERGGITVNASIAAELLKAGLVSGSYKGFGHAQAGTPALVIEKERR